MLSNYTAKYTRTASGYMAQLVEWPEVVTEGKTLEQAREMLKDASNEMVAAYHQQGKAKPYQVKQLLKVIEKYNLSEEKDV
ncbi:MAG: type II toxin-antitoxin system HicB family antitoxin [Candidatus Ratteibacteria bacterium]|nr:type II toxin-antitoxin system HicB family antitoxin [Candidatus Ratteibacteria bacterium]